MAAGLRGVIDIKPGIYYVGQWLVVIPGGDVCYSLCRPEDSPTDWLLSVRFAQHVNAQPFNGKDKRVTLRLFQTGTEEEVVSKLKQSIAALPPPARLEGFLEVRGNSEKFAEILDSDNLPDWMHVQKQIVA